MSIESDTSSTAENIDRPSRPNLRSSSARSRAHNGSNWKSRQAQEKDGAVVKAALESQAALSPLPDSDMDKTARHSSYRSPRQGLWSISIFSLLIASLGIGLLLTILGSIVTRQLDPKGCRMSYMRPSYVRFSEFDTEHTRFATKYSLYLYREQGADDPNRLHGTPVLFIPGNAGSYKQVRPIAAEAATYFKNQLMNDGHSLDDGVRNLDFFTVDFNEDITAFHGQTLLDQAEYLNEAVRYILSLYSDPAHSVRSSQLPDPTSVIILGHSMGGIVARAMLVQSNYQANSINSIITMSAPHARAAVTFDGQMVQLYDEINDYWRNAYSQKSQNNNPLRDVTLVSIAGGNLDTIVPSDYASLESIVPETHGFTVFTTGIPTVWTGADHQAILWCDQFRKVVARALYDIIDVHRASQTKARAERMQSFRKRFLTGLEAKSERAQPEKATTLLTLDDSSTAIVAAGERLTLSSLGGHPRGKAFLIPVPPQGSPGHKRFTLITDGLSSKNDRSILLCSVFSQPHAPFTAFVDLSGTSEATTKLVCRNAADDIVLLPASTTSTTNPFQLKEGESQPFSYLQYDLEKLFEYHFIAVVDRGAASEHRFMIADFGDASNALQVSDVSLTNLLSSGLATTLPANRPMAAELRIPSMASSLLAYTLEIKEGSCHGKKPAFAPLVRQYMDRPYESRYFVNANHVSVGLHGAAPYLPPPLQRRVEDGVTFQFWTDPTCDAPLHINLEVDVFGSLGKLYMRYRTVFAAFPLLIVTLVLRKQFRVYDKTGTFVAFSESLDLSLKRSIPLLVLSMTMLSMSAGGVVSAASETILRGRNRHSLSPIDFHRNDLLIGTDDPFFWFLVPLIGTVCIGVCVVLHYVVLTLTHLFAGIYYLVGASPATTINNESRPSTPRRRMITTATLMFLVSFLIPYQFAYLVACLVQLFTVVRALRVSRNAPCTTTNNYYHYAHSVLLLMLWILPINLPILAVWIRNLAVHWLTPFSSHHNVLSIMPFILLVENITTGRMVPQLRGGLRHVTSILLFATALCAAIYGVSHAYMLHHLVNIIALWLVTVHSTSGSWSLSGMFTENGSEKRKSGKKP